MRTLHHWFQAACTRYAYLDFLRFMAQRCALVRVGEIAASLTYTTLLALVPLLTIMLVVLSAFPIFGDVSDAFMRFVHEIIVPQSAASIATYLHDFHQHTKKLTSLGLAVMAVSALLLIYTLDVTFNRIWQVKQEKPLWLRVLIYCLLLVLTPLFVSASITASAYFFHLNMLNQLPQFSGSLKSLIQFVLDVVLFYLTFQIVPNCFVPGKIALLGAVLTSVFLELTKAIFAWYVRHLGNFELIYGAFGVIPIFLLWLHALWMIVLIGAVFTASLSDWTKNRTQ